MVVYRSLGFGLVTAVKGFDWIGDWVNCSPTAQQRLVRHQNVADGRKKKEAMTVPTPYHCKGDPSK